MALMRVLSALADSAVLLPVALGTLLLLAGRREWAAAGALGASLAACAVATLLVKLLFNACGASLTPVDLVSPSGHASLAAAVYGTLALLAAPPGRLLRTALPVGAAALILGVGASRVVLRYHSWPEVLFGWAVGGGAVALFGWLHARAGRPSLPPLGLAALAALGAALVLFGYRFTPEWYVARAARHLAATLDVCPDDGAAHRAQQARRRSGR